MGSLYLVKRAKNNFGWGLFWGLFLPFFFCGSVFLPPANQQKTFLVRLCPQYCGRKTHLLIRHRCSVNATAYHQKLSYRVSKVQPADSWRNSLFHYSQEKKIWNFKNLVVFYNEAQIIIDPRMALTQCATLKRGINRPKIDAGYWTILDYFVIFLFSIFVQNTWKLLPVRGFHFRYTKTSNYFSAENMKIVKIGLKLDDWFYLGTTAQIFTNKISLHNPFRWN